MIQLVLLRHGESTWNKENRFTGWVDVGLSEKGLGEAKEAGRLLKEKKFEFDKVYTSRLKRAIKTLWIVLEEMDLMWIPVTHSWRLNERHYGALQGLNKTETVQKYGEEQVLKWRRSYDIPPPPVSPDSEYYPGNDKRYSDLHPDEIPSTECLKDTLKRFAPIWEDQIAPEIKKGKRVLIAAHGNSLRGLVKMLDGIPDSGISDLNIPTGIPLVYELEDDLRPIRHYYLGDPEKIKQAVEGVASQTRRNG